MSAKNTKNTNIPFLAFRVFRGQFFEKLTRMEKIAKHEDHVYAGKRIKRGLFASALCVIINADINGALNILRKAIGDNFLQPFIQKVARLIPSSGYLSYPLKVCL